MPVASLLIHGDVSIGTRLTTRKKGFADFNLLVILGDLEVGSLDQSYGSTVLVSGTLTVHKRASIKASDGVFYQFGPVRANEVLSGTGGGSCLTCYHSDVQIKNLKSSVANRSGQKLPVKSFPS